MIRFLHNSVSTYVVLSNTIDPSSKKIDFGRAFAPILIMLVAVAAFIRSEFSELYRVVAEKLH